LTWDSMLEFLFYYIVFVDHLLMLYKSLKF
jgi:hypothetical protein